MASEVQFDDGEEDEYDPESILTCEIVSKALEDARSTFLSA